MRVPGLKTVRSFAARLRARVRPGGIILLYHRIADTDCDPWGNCVSPARFEQHLEVLRRLAHPCRLAEIVDSVRRGENVSGKVALTFDDGYADNYHIAKPSLHATGTPATFFLVSDRTGSLDSYWWDELADILLCAGRLPESLSGVFVGPDQELQLGDAVEYSPSDRRADRDIRAWEARPGSRLAFYYHVWSRLRPLRDKERSLALEKIRAWASRSPSRPAAPITITAPEANSLAAEGLVEIGSHSKSHASLPDLSPSEQRQELADSKAALEEVIGRPVRSFAYPYGSCGRETPGLLRDAGYTSACTVVHGHVRSSDDPFLLPRITVSDSNGDEFERRLFRFLGL